MSGKTNLWHWLTKRHRFYSILPPLDRATHLLLQELLKGLLGLFLCVPLVGFLLKFWPFLLWGFDTGGKIKDEWLIKKRMKGKPSCVYAVNAGWYVLMVPYLGFCYMMWQRVAEVGRQSSLSDRSCLPGWDLCGGWALCGSHRCIRSLDLSCESGGRLGHCFLWDGHCRFCLHYCRHRGCTLCLHCRSRDGCRSRCLSRPEMTPEWFKLHHPV